MIDAESDNTFFITYMTVLLLDLDIQQPSRKTLVAAFLLMALFSIIVITRPARMSQFSEIKKDSLEQLIIPSFNVAHSLIFVMRSLGIRCVPKKYITVPDTIVARAVHFSKPKLDLAVQFCNEK